MAWCSSGCAVAAQREGELCYSAHWLLLDMKPGWRVDYNNWLLVVRSLETGFQDEGLLNVLRDESFLQLCAKCVLGLNRKKRTTVSRLRGESTISIHLWFSVGEARHPRKRRDASRPRCGVPARILRRMRPCLIMPNFATVDHMSGWWRGISAALLNARQSENLTERFEKTVADGAGSELLGTLREVREV